MKDPIWYFFVTPIALLAIQLLCAWIYLACRKKLLTMLRNYKESQRLVNLYDHNIYAARKEQRIENNHRKLTKGE